MLTDHADLKSLADQLVRRRHDLRRDLLDPYAEAGHAARWLWPAAAERRPRPPKALYRLTDGRHLRAVRNRLVELKGLRRDLEAAALEHGVALTRQIGLWLPAVADQEAGDRWVNVMVYANRAGRVLPAHDAYALASAGRNGPRTLSRMEELARTLEHVRLSRDAGQAFRLMIAGDQRATLNRRTGHEDRYALYNLHDFALVLGDLPVNLPQPDRPRRRRRGALDLAQEPLCTFYDRDGLWAVYPAA